jgi:hypothetical protein
VRRVNDCGHPDKRHVAHGKCPACYTAWLRASNPQKDARDRQKARARFHGIELEDFERILAEQDGCCGLCGKRLRSRRDRHIDHCHRTGRVRGVLCFTCNKGLGMLGDNEVGLRRAIAYLRGQKFDVKHVGILPGEQAA